MPPLPATTPMPAQNPRGVPGPNLGLARQDDRNEAEGFEIYFQRARTSGTAAGSPVRLTTAAGSSRIPALSWGGTQWGVAWEDVRDGDYEEVVDPVALPNNAQPRFLRFTCP
jgi:hypothetical protein